MHKVLIANRGEIAVRVIRACHDLGLQTVAVYSTADAEALHVLHADEAVCIGEPPAAKSYLKVANLLSACEITGADAIHPGYGFLAESSRFASICESCGLTFIGPSSASIALLGDKAEAKATAKRAGCPIIPGSEGVVRDLESGMAIAQELGYPLFIKAVAGGGGKGIRIAYDREQFCKLFIAARAEAEASFGNGDLYLEQMIHEPRHVEVQVIADRQGHALHLFERDCTIQRRRQKLIEETPSPAVSPSLREQMGQAALAVVRAAGYFSAATVEFLLDREGRFYFMEVNTRIQVEHTVTEELTGVDLIVQQLRIADGQPLLWHQSDFAVGNRHVMEFRINAEDPARQFAPSVGKLDYYLPPGGPHVRVDSGCYSGYSIPPYYDSMIGKLIVSGSTRDEVIARSKRALKEFHIGGVHTTIPFHLYMLHDEAFCGGHYDLGYIDRLLAEGVHFRV